jgi:hypothetical protein
VAKFCCRRPLSPLQLAGFGVGRQEQPSLPHPEEPPVCPRGSIGEGPWKSGRTHIAGRRTHTHRGTGGLTVTQVDGKDRRQVGGFDVTPDEMPLFLASVQAIAAYAAGTNPNSRPA